MHDTIAMMSPTSFIMYHISLTGHNKEIHAHKEQVRANGLDIEK
jgi:hypothetical protein